MKPPRWQEISPSQFDWEREALAFLRERLPDHEPYRAWSNFEFIADDGTINEVDVLVLTPAGLHLIEIKSRPGEISGDAHSWTWKHEGRRFTDDNPLFSTNRKAKKLASLLRRQKALARHQLPFIEACVFSSAQNVLKLPSAVMSRVFVRDSGTPPRGGIVEAITTRRDHSRGPAINAPLARAVGRAISDAGIRPTNRSRRVADYTLKRVLHEHPSGLFQDWAAEHVTLPDLHRMLRLYPVVRGTPKDQREIAKRAFQRELRLLQTLEHEGILQVESPVDHETGDVLVFRLQGR